MHLPLIKSITALQTPIKNASSLALLAPVTQYFHVAPDKHFQPIGSPHPQLLIDFVDLFVNNMTSGFPVLVSCFRPFKDGPTTSLFRNDSCFLR